MDSSLHSIVGATYVQDRMAIADARRAVRELKRETNFEQPSRVGRLSAVWRRFGAPAQTVRVKPLPPR